MLIFLCEIWRSKLFEMSLALGDKRFLGMSSLNKLRVHRLPPTKRNTPLNNAHQLPLVYRAEDNTPNERTYHRFLFGYHD
jgi:hypothetical protein